MGMLDSFESSILHCISRSSSNAFVHLMFRIAPILSMPRNYLTPNDAKKMVASKITSNDVLIQVSVANLTYGIFSVCFPFLPKFSLLISVVLDQPRSRLMKYPILFKRIHKRVRLTTCTRPRPLTFLTNRKNEQIFFESKM